MSIDAERVINEDGHSVSDFQNQSLLAVDFGYLAFYILYSYILTW